MYKIISAYILSLFLIVNAYAEDSDYMPFSVGSWWEYSDGTKSEIVGTQILYNGIKANKAEVSNCQNCGDPAQSFINYIYKKNGIVFITHSLDAKDKYCSIKYPVEQGDSWVRTEDNEIICTTYVAGFDTVTTPCDTFYNCVRLEDRYNGLIDKSWYAPGVGMVRSESKKEQGGTIAINLINYNVVE